MNERQPLHLAGPAGAAAGSGEITFIGTATVLMRIGGFTILTDPNFLHRGQRAYLGLGLTAKRLTEPALSIGDLPGLDFVVLSHHHGDHFDRIAAKGLDHDLPVITEPHAARKLRSQGFRRPVALRTWQAQAITRGDCAVTVTSVPAKHAPRPLGFAIPPVMGSVLDFSRAGARTLRLYITGDTLLHGGLAAMAHRFPDIDLCLIHLGGTRIAGVLLTMDAAQGVAALRMIAPREAIPVHYDDYSVFKSPLPDFARATESAGLPTRVRYLDRGESYSFGLAQAAPGGPGPGRPGTA
jgi:L-ascorbate metabolism protein UlaG (beta-lactamase superfamily)